MSLEKAVAGELTLETLDAQFCSDWLKEKIRELLVTGVIYRTALKVIQDSLTQESLKNQAVDFALSFKPPAGLLVEGETK